ncbi:MAG: hypothetical protein AAGF20_10955, partial [Pseudomonadota bacterium]
NMIDCLAPEARLALENSALMQAEPPILVSAASGEGLEGLQARLLADLKAGGQTFAVQLPGTAGRARSWLHQYGDVEQEMVLEDGGVSLEVWLDAKAAGQFATQFPEFSLQRLLSGV